MFLRKRILQNRNKACLFFSCIYSKVFSYILNLHHLINRYGIGMGSLAQRIIMLAKSILFLLLAGVMSISALRNHQNATTCYDIVHSYAEEMNVAVCHQTAAIVFAVFEGVWEKTVSLYSDSIPVLDLKKEILSGSDRAAYMITAWEFEPNKSPFPPHSWVIDRMNENSFRLWTSYADAYSGGYILQEFLVDEPWFGWSQFAAGRELNSTDIENMFDFLNTAYTDSGDSNGRATADWNVWCPDLLNGYINSYGYGYAPGISYKVSYYKTSSPVTDERCVANEAVVETMRADCFENSQTCIQFQNL